MRLYRFLIAQFVSAQLDHVDDAVLHHDLPLVDCGGLPLKFFEFLGNQHVSVALGPAVVELESGIDPLHHAYLNHVVLQQYLLHGSVERERSQEKVRCQPGEVIVTQVEQAHCATEPDLVGKLAAALVGDEVLR